MSFSRPLRSPGLVSVFSLTFLLGLVISFVPAMGSANDEKKSPDPWSSSQTLQPAVLAKQFIDKYSSMPTVVFVGFRSLYIGGHVPDASFHGTAATEQGLAELRSWAGTLPRTTAIVIYCGCCPFDKCPNIRPAYTALSNMGFKKLRVLVIPNDFATDWAAKGYPMQKGM